ncbi:MAG: hypothetical protein AAF755_04325 [Pseudomonadota bacterium]
MYDPSKHYFEPIAHYNEIHRETHRRVYPWLAGPLLGRHISFVPSEELENSKDKVLKSIVAFQNLLKACDPSCLSDNTQDRWIFDANPDLSLPASNNNKLGDRPAHLRISKPYLSHPVPIPFGKDGAPIKYNENDALPPEHRCDHLPTDQDAYHLRLLLRGDIFGEYMTMTQIIELPFNTDMFYRLGYNSEIASKLQYLMGVRDVPHLKPAPEDNACLRKILFEEIWEKVDASLHKQSHSGGGASALLAPVSRKASLQYFGDFRLVSPQHPKAKFPKVELQTVDEPSEEAGQRQKDNRHKFHYQRAKLPGIEAIARGSASQKSLFADEFVANELSKYRPIWANARHDEGKSEIVAATFLNQSVLYVSSLGFEAVENTGETRNPLTLMKASSLTDPWQLSRLLFRLFSLGTLRLMAVRQLPRLYHAKYEMEELEKETIAALDSPRGALKLAQNYRELSAKLRKIEETGFADEEVFNAIYGDPDSEQRKNGKRMLVGGLQYRIARSTYYARSYRERIGDLNEGKIPGYQSYQELMRRRLYATFAFVEGQSVFIQRINGRLESLASEIRRQQIKFTNWVLVLATVLGVVLGTLTFACDKSRWASSSMCALAEEEEQTVRPNEEIPQTAGENRITRRKR